MLHRDIVINMINVSKTMKDKSPILLPWMQIIGWPSYVTSVNMLLWAGRTLFITALFIIFVIFFGRPSYLQYREKKTLIRKGLKKKGEIPKRKDEGGEG